MVHELVFTTDNPCSTTIYDSEHPDEIVYYVDSVQDGKKFFTIVERQGQELAKLQWHESTPDVIHFAADILPPTRMNVWMKPSLIPFVNTRTFTDVKKRKYKWKHVGSGSAMELWCEDLSEPIAVFEKSLPVTNRKASLKLDDRAMEVQDLVVISFLFLEKVNRIRAQASNSRANAIAAVSSFGVNNSAQVAPGRDRPKQSGQAVAPPKF